MTHSLLLCCRGGPPAEGTCLQDVALLDGRVLQPAGLLLQLQSSVAQWQAGDHVLRDPERALAALHGLDFGLERLHLRQQALKGQGHISNILYFKSFISQARDTCKL